jgi:hypothetical protein
LDRYETIRDDLQRILTRNRLIGKVRKEGQYELEVP